MKKNYFRPVDEKIDQLKQQVCPDKPTDRALASALNVTAAAVAAWRSRGKIPDHVRLRFPITAPDLPRVAYMFNASSCYAPVSEHAKWVRDVNTRIEMGYECIHECFKRGNNARITVTFTVEEVRL